MAEERTEGQPETLEDILESIQLNLDAEVLARLVKLCRLRPVSENIGDALDLLEYAGDAVGFCVELIQTLLDENDTLAQALHQKSEEVQMFLDIEAAREAAGSRE